MHVLDAQPEVMELFQTRYWLHSLLDVMHLGVLNANAVKEVLKKIEELIEREATIKNESEVEISVDFIDYSVR